MTYKINKNIPITNIRKGKGRPSTYPFAEMQVGDSFFVSIKDKRPRMVGNAANQYTRHHGGSPKFITRSVDGGSRCWRIPDAAHPVYPFSPRLSPDGTYYICDRCDRTWMPGSNPGCPECAAAFIKD